MTKKTHIYIMNDSLAFCCLFAHRKLYRYIPNPEDANIVRTLILLISYGMIFLELLLQ